jgi:hypothetical protein
MHSITAKVIEMLTKKSSLAIIGNIRNLEFESFNTNNGRTEVKLDRKLFVCLE